MVKKDKNSITPMVKLVKHDEASETFGQELFYTDGDMRYLSTFGGVSMQVFVPAGFLTDGASVPEMFQKLFPVWDTYYQAAVFHDYLCEYLTIYIGDILTPMKITRTEADNIFNDIMKLLNTNPLKRKLVYSAVKMYSHAKSIIYPSAAMTKRGFEIKINEDLKMRDKIVADQKRK